MLIKACGLTSAETIAAAAQAGATHVGLVHFAPSPRHVELDKAARLRACVPQGVKAVVLLVDPDADLLAAVIAQVKPDVIQLHGKETPEQAARLRQQGGFEVWKALSVRSAESLADATRYEGAVDRVLFDAPPPADSTLPGGNGEAFDWTLLKGHDHRIDWGLAGGLTPDNVAAAIHATGTPLVDASSGLESAPGVKDVGKIAAFCAAALSA
ncbi:MAG: phosphoribosylanthranilate isomerase [Erythrobacteraceae bacterium]|nr:phosphoribosylanthranilate isomerase [Erythrobacteraceae bacterium]